MLSLIDYLLGLYAYKEYKAPLITIGLERYRVALVLIRFITILPLYIEVNNITLISIVISKALYIYNLYNLATSLEL